MSGTARVIRANALDLPLADSSVDLIVTSPPYFGLRSYQDGGEHYAGQIGSEPTPAEFVDALIAATAEMVRVLKPSGSIWVNLGDKYAQSASRWQGSRRGGGASSQVSARHLAANEFGQGAWNDAPDMAVRPKSLIGVPWRYALRCIDDLGLILRAEVIWSKPNGLPESVTDRVRRSHEQWFHFTREPRYFAAVDEIREEHSEWSKRAMEGRWVRHSNRVQEGTGSAGSISKVGKPLGESINPLGKLPGSVWTVPTQPLRVPEHLGIDHFAAFPMEWPRRIIQGWSPSGVCVECGEGRRPVKGDTGQIYGQQYANHRRAAELIREHGFDMSELRALGTSGWERWKAKGVHVHPSQGWDYKKDLCERIERLLGGYAECAIVVSSTKVMAITGEICACPEPTAPTTPAVVLDPFGGTGTTALVAKALGRHGISVDMSADYCRLAGWRTNDPDELARAMQVEKPAKQVEGQSDLFDLIDECAS